MFCTTCCIKYCCKYIKRIDWAAVRSHVAALENAWKCCCCFFFQRLIHACLVFLWIKKKRETMGPWCSLTVFPLRRHERGMRGRCTDQRGGTVTPVHSESRGERGGGQCCSHNILKMNTVIFIVKIVWIESLWAPLTLNILWK